MSFLSEKLQLNEAECSNTFIANIGIPLVDSGPRFFIAPSAPIHTNFTKCTLRLKPSQDDRSYIYLDEKGSNFFCSIRTAFHMLRKHFRRQAEMFHFIVKQALCPVTGRSLNQANCQFAL